MLGRAEHAAAADPQARSIRQWFELLLDEEARADSPGKQTEIEDPAPEDDDRAQRPCERAKPARGRQTLVIREARDGEAPAGPQRASEPSRLPSAPALDLAALWRRSEGLGFNANGTVIRPAAADAAVGRALPDEVAARLGPYVGADAVAAARVHTDADADRVAATHRARAVALGDQIFFARGEYAPGTAHGDELLAHELTHVAQARRGDLHRAAAKGLESGGTLDPAEAEADLRAKLAVIQLHPPTGATPALAAPSGQPTSDGDRAAKIAAQQQRLALAGQDTPDATAAPEPPASRPQPPVVHPAPPLPQPAAPAPAATGNAYVSTFEAPPSKQATEKWDQTATQATTQAAADQAKFDASLPPMPVVLDGREAPSAGTGGSGGGGVTPTPPVAGATPPAAQPTPTPAPPAVTNAATAASSVQPNTDKAQLKADAQAAIDALPTTAPDVSTSPGPAPVTDLAGGADPMRMVGDHGQAIGDGAKALEAEKQKVISGPGAAQVQPAKLDEKLKVPASQSGGPMPALPSVDGMTKFKSWNLPSSAQTVFDDVAKPKLDVSLAEAKSKMTQAETKRDADRTKAVSDANDKVKQAHADADKQQQQKVAETRTQIANHQADTLVKQETEVKKLDQQSNAKKQGTIGKINERVQADQAKVDADYKAAQQKADEQKQKGEQDAAEKKRKAQEKKEDQSWWDSIADAICEEIDRIASEIDQALQAIGQAIGQILDAVKEAACSVIDAARDFVCQALTEFGDWLKSAVTALLGSVFPELAAALNQLIDAAVNAAKAAVTAIADGLKTAVSALCDGLKGAIDAALAAFRAAVQAAATFAKAAVTGDWKLVGKMVLEGILKLLGIDPAAFWALIGKAEDSIDKIIENPGAFVGHLVDAVKLGFQQFGTNFWTHLKNGVVQWLFGTFAEAGIRMPASFDIAGIFDLVAQVLGLTWTRMRGKVVKLIGEKNTERLEFVGKYVEALITGGFAGLWEKIKQDMSSLWDMVVGGIKSWLIENVVQQAIVKIATMWNPAGAIIQLIQTAWNVYQWLRENAQRIFGLIQAVVDSIANIAAGNITGAANFIESSLAKLVPIAISLFANLLGLGGISDKIKGIIEKVQDTVDKAIDKLIERVLAMFKGKGDAGDKNDDKKEIGARIEFNAGGHVHTQYIDASGPTPVPMVASTPTAVEAKLQNDWQPKINKLQPADQTRAGALVTEALAIEKKVAALAAAVKKGEPDTELRAQQQLLADKLLDLFIVMDDNDAGADAQKRIIYAALGDARRQILGDRETQAAIPPTTDDDFQVKYQRLIQAAASAYEGACRARGTGNVFSFFGHDYFVDHQNNYVIPDADVGTNRAVLDGKIYVFPAGSRLTRIEQLTNNAPRDQIITSYAYGGYRTSAGGMQDALRGAVDGNFSAIDAAEGAMMLAVLVAESRRNPNANVTNAMLLAQQTPGPIKNNAPMVGGGTDDPTKKRDQELSGGLEAIIQLPPQKVTDREIAMIQTDFEKANPKVGALITSKGADAARQDVAQYLIGATHQW